MSRHSPRVIQLRASVNRHCHRWNPHAVNKDQIPIVKNLRDRLLPFFRSKNRKWLQLEAEIPLRAKARSWRDRAMVFVLLSTGFRRDELVNLNLSQLNV